MTSKKSTQLFLMFLKNIFLAPISLSKAASEIYCGYGENPKNTWRHAILFWGLFLGSILFFSLQAILDGCWAIGVFLYFCFCACIAKLRMNARDKLYITGHPVEDFLCSLIMYPSVCIQLEMTLKNRKETHSQLQKCVS